MAKDPSCNKHPVPVGPHRKGVVAIDTTSGPETTRTASLGRWIKRTQEVLAFRANRGSSFHRLFNLVRTKRLIEIALDNVLGNEGARTAGVDGMTKVDLRQQTARDALIGQLHEELCAKTYRPSPVRRVYIPKPNGEQRPLGIPTLKDRVVQEMLRLILEPIYEGRFHPHSYGFRPYRSTHHAALRIKDLAGRRGYNYAIEGDIRKCFDRVQHTRLLNILRQTIKDERIVRLVKQMLKAGVMEDEAWHQTDEGTPQGGILSPLLANIYLNELDWFIAGKWEQLAEKERTWRRYHKTATPCMIVRYADDFIVMVQGTAELAHRLKVAIAEFLDQELHLELSADKTLVTPMQHGVDFLGFQIRTFRGATLIVPSRKAMARFRDQVRARVRRELSRDEVAGIVNLNRYLIGWGMYYRRVSSARHFKAADHYVWHRVWKTTRRLRANRGQVKAHAHYRRHYISYRFDINPKNRWRIGRHYGVWADAAQTRAHIVVRLAFSPIRYVRLHPQLNPYVPTERAQLDHDRGLTQLLADSERDAPKDNPDYGVEWRMVRREVLIRAGHRCQSCRRSIAGRLAHVHHLVKLKQAASRRRANLLENLIALCPECHRRNEREHDG